MTEFNNEFILLFKTLGKALAEGLKAKNLDSPKFDNMADESEYIENPFLSALFSGLSDDCFNKKLARNIIEAISKIANPNYESLTGWRDSIVTFVKTHSKSTISMLTHV